MFRRLAAEFAAQGQRIFPLVPGTKRPYAGSHGHLDATDDPLVVSRWASEMPDANIGIRPPDNLIVLDFDSPEALSWSTEQGLELPPTRTVATRRGWHYYYRLKEPIKARAHVPDVKIDIKTERGFVLAPGSVVEGHGYRLLHEGPVTELPTDWLPLVIRPRPVPRTVDQEGRYQGDPTRLARLLNVMRPGEGRRSFLRWALCQAHRDYAGAELAQAIHALIEAADCIGLDSDNTAELAEWAASQFHQETER
ncbi:bifunctional DNA primase/polymerase [Mycolicibacillus koreensis]|uniref:bifunctional DNA primase/polymerase n=1 Tax=Mycolicibacillus koreensis TaxID=1069220 RepID=UPI0021F36A10|nr:bifunctional DNA primase/polymerase [Mycolicibacillus koreensis]